jgi:stearoyl-CoA desaturase (delta-9 desaturase)
MPESLPVPDPLSVPVQPAPTEQPPLNLSIAAIVLVLHILALAAFTQPFRPAYLALGAAFYAWGALSTTLYLHRCLTHKGLRLAAPLRGFFALGTAISLGGDPVVWVGIHRRHHASSDGPGDPHAPGHGFWRAHFLWALRVTPDLERDFRGLANDVREDPVCRALERPAIYAGSHVLVALAVWWWGGWPALTWGFYLPMVLLVHATYAVNSVCHVPVFGVRPHETRDTSRNVWWLALPTFGEAYHNNHHADPRCARHGRSWREPDLTAGTVWILEKLRLARNVAW